MSLKTLSQLTGLAAPDGSVQGTLVDSTGNLVGEVQQDGAIKFSTEEIQKYIIGSTGSNGTNSLVEKSGLNLSPSDNIVGGVDFTTVHSYGATGDSVSGKPSLIVFDSIKNQPTVLFNKVQINSPFDGSSEFGRIEAFGYFHNPHDAEVQYIDVNYKRPDGYVTYKQIGHSEIDPSGNFKLELPFEGATQIGTWELLSSTITLTDNSVYQISFSNSEEPKTFETIDARPYDNSGMQSIGTNQSLPANVVNFENEYFSKQMV